MSLLDTYSEDMIAAAEQAPAPLPVKQPTQRFSAWGMTKAAPKGVAAGTAEGLASGADVGKAIADKVPANVSGPLGRVPFMNAITSVMQVGADILNPKEGQFTSEAGTSLRNVAKDYTPDPTTTHVAESAVFNLFRVGSKALTAAAALGNIPGAVLAGAEEGFTQSDQLGRQGVDLATRTKVGAVVAATNAAGFALPVAGKTWAQTAGLALAGGPVSFVAQQAATRKILEDADYSKLADQYDPFDQVGLALSTVLPMGFGALAMRGTKIKAKGPMPDGTPPPDVPPVPQSVTPKFRGMTEDEYIAAITQGKATREFNDPIPQDAFDSLPNTGEPAGSFNAKDGTNIELVKGSGDYNGAIFAVADGKTVGYMAPEAGTTGLFVSDDFRGKGIGEALSTAYRTENPMAPSGGFSAAGEAIARKVFRKLAGSEMPEPKVAPPDDLVDAARVTLLRENMDATNPVRGDMAAENAHSTAYTKAMEQQAEGRPVSVMDVVPKIEPIAGKATDTPNFKAWFGESKVVDDAGAPLVVYHGTKTQFDSFDAESIGSNSGNKGYFGKGFYFSDSSDLASKYGDPKPMFISAKNPFVLSDENLKLALSLTGEVGEIPGARAADKLAFAVSGNEDVFTKNLLSLGHDSFVATYEIDGKTVREIVAFDPKQIKSAIGNSGKFDPNSGSLTDNPIADWGAGLTKALDDMRAEVEKSKQKQALAPVDTAPAATEKIANSGRDTNGVMANQNDVVGNQGGRSADDSTPGALSPVEAVKKAARDAFFTYQKRTGAEGDAASFEVDDNNTPVQFRAGAAEQELENLGWEVGTKTAGFSSNDASHYITARKLVASDAEYGDEYVTAKIRISNHGNTTRAHDHPDVNIAPGEDIVWDIEEKLNQKITDEGYELPVSAPSDARLGYAIATEQAQRGKPSDGSGGNTTTNESTAPDGGGASKTLSHNNVQDQTPPAGTKTQAPADQAGANAPGNAAPATGVPGTGAADLQANGVKALDSRLADIEARNPGAMDAMIATEFDDAGKPTNSVSVRDFLDQVKRDAMADEADAGLLEVAANCFLNGGL